MGIDENVLVALGGLLLVIGIISLIWLVIWIVANWQIFKKAGEPGWKCIIPYYNTYTQFGFTWNTNMFWVYLGLSLMPTILQFLLGRDNAFVALISFVFGIALIVIGVMAIHKLSKAFGHGVGFTLGLIFLNPIFVLILAFGSSEYQGIPD
ncbi:MAG: hypothetical protein IJ661_12940 [Lachnospiraceae bacterium]|nr:hypothetical protein [Lachnospiraceae bacterium]